MDLNRYTFPQYHLQQIRVHSYEVDLNRRLTITALFSLLQEIAWEHAHLLRYGWEHLLQKGWFWALSRLDVELYQIPAWTEELTLVTWPRGLDGIFALRDFEFYNSLGERVIAATSSWLVLNIETRRPVRDSWHSDFDFVERSALSANAAKLSGVNGIPVYTEPLNVRIGDIDMNMHVNNVRYIDWAYNTFGIEHFQSYIPQKVVVNFNAEAKANQQVDVIRFQPEPNQSLIDINFAGNGKNLCRLMFYWKKI